MKNVIWGFWFYTFSLSDDALICAKGQRRSGSLKDSWTSRTFLCDTEKATGLHHRSGLIFSLSLQATMMKVACSQDFKTRERKEGQMMQEGVFFFLGSAWKLARTHARKSPAVPLQGTVIGSCHMVLNSPFFKGSGKDTEMHQGRQCEASFTTLTCQTGCWLFQQQLVCSPVRFVSGEVGKIHMLLSRYMMERSVGEKMQNSWS